MADLILSPYMGRNRVFVQVTEVVREVFGVRKQHIEDKLMLYMLLIDLNHVES